MSDLEELSEDEANINTVTEIPNALPFKLTMEVPLFLLMFGITLSGAVINNLVLFRTCIHSLEYSEEQCRLLQAPPEDKSNETQLIEEEAQKYVTRVMMVRSVMEAVCPAVLSLFLGVWSQTHGRKPLVECPCLLLHIGFFCSGSSIITQGLVSIQNVRRKRERDSMISVVTSSILVVVYSLCGNLGPWWYVVSGVPLSLSGGVAALFTGAFSYLTDITQNNNRSIRLALLEASIFVGSIVGSLLSWYLLQLVGAVCLLLLHSTVYVAAYVFTNLAVQESIQGALQGGLGSVLDWRLAREMFSLCFRRSPYRSRVLLLLGANSLSLVALMGLLNLEYLYVRRLLGWGVRQYSGLAAADTALLVAGLGLGAGLLGLGLPDLPLAGLAYLSALAGVLVKAFATDSWHMYLGAGVSLLRGLAGPLSRAEVSRLARGPSTGAALALGCAGDAVLPLGAPLLFGSLYSRSLAALPGAVYLLSAALYTLCSLIVLACVYLQRRSERYAAVEDDSPICDIPNDL